MEFGLFDSILVLLATAVLVASLFHHFRVPPILGYLLIGILVGPYQLAWIPDTQITRDLAELGVVFLLFTIGLEFSWARLLSMKRDVFILGGLQVSIVIIVTTLIGMMIGMGKVEAFLIGSVVAMSSTAIVSKQLTEQVELMTSHGMRSMGILLFQDLAVIPLLIAIPNIADAQAPSLLVGLLLALIKGTLAILAIMYGGRWIFKPLFYYIAKTRSVELFTLTALLVTLGAAWVTHEFGLSLALGAFLAGILLGETEFRHQIEADIRPFRDVLLGLFFISIGMQIHVVALLHAWPWLLLLLSALIGFKFLIVAAICYVSSRSITDSVRSGLILAHGGEFGFALLTLALSYKSIPQDDAQVVLGALFLSMALAPFFIRYNGAIVERLFPQQTTQSQENISQDIESRAASLQGHVIICGYGRIGQNVARILAEFSIAYIALDLDAPRVQTANLAGENVCYGNASYRDLLVAAGLRHAKAVVISFNDPHQICETLARIREHHASIPVLVRTEDESDVEICYQHGATVVVPEVLETGLSMAAQLLLSLKKPPHEVSRLVNRIRRDRYDLLQQVIPGEDTWDNEDVESPKVILYPINIPADAAIIGKRLSDCDLDESIKLIAIRRGKQRITDPDTIIQVHDVIVLSGPASAIEHAETTILV